jgi:diguanylate cyclase (GGDEF)-like protein/PAS domain S-box-containing protein
LNIAISRYRLTAAWRQPAVWRYLIQAAIIVVTYWLSAKAGLTLAFANSSVTAVWPPTGLALAALLIWGLRMWPAVAVAAFVANATISAPPLAAILGITVGNTLEAVLAATLLVRFAHFRLSLDRVRDVLALLVLGAVLSTIVAATIGSLSLSLDNSLRHASFGAVWRTWWFGDMGGDLLVAPALLVLATHKLWRLDRRQLGELALAGLALAGLCVLVFSTRSAFPYVLFPILFWVAFRFGRIGAVVAGLVMSGLAVYFTANGHGPFAVGSPDSNLLRAETFAGLVAITGLLVAALVGERRRAEADLTSSEALNEALTQSQLRLAEAQRISRVGSWDWDVDRDRFTCSDELLRIYGRDRDAFIPTYDGFIECVHSEDRARVDRILKAALSGQAPFAFEHVIFRPDGSTRTVQARGDLVMAADGKSVVCLSGTSQDVTERKRSEDQLRRMADYDSLTGLYNRRRFADALAHRVSYVERYGGEGAVLLLDLDHFKYVNDTAGHSVGDQLIATVGRRLRERLRETDTLGRLGGDEFAVLLPTARAKQAREVAADLLAAMREHPLLVGASRPLKVTTSIGIAVFDGEGHLSAEEILVEADVAMYAAKEQGRDAAVVYDRGSGHHAAMQAHQAWSERLQVALADDGFTLHCQPIVDLRTGATEMHELLLRLPGERGQLFSPGAFLDHAQRFGLTGEIDRWVIGRAIEILAADNGPSTPAKLTVNLSAASLDDGELPELVRRLAAEADVRPDRLVFEVTETAAIADIDRARNLVDQLRHLGCQFALDDFGSGFGSFHYLKHLAFDYLKIDGEFIQQLGENSDDQIVVGALVEAARGLGKKTIAEFVEDAATSTMLGEIGVDLGQGYHFGRPVPIEGVLEPLPPAPQAVPG